MRRPLDHVTYGARNAKSLVAPLTSDANPANIEVRVILLVLWLGLIKPRSLLKKNTLVKVPSTQSDMANNNLKNRRFSTLSGAFTAIKSETNAKLQKN